MSKEKLKNIRVTVANKAAELISEEGITDYHYAKTKAAKFLGLNTKEKLPSNTEIDEALISFKNIYQKADIKLINELKKITLKFMRLFKEFNPHAPSQILEGYISKYPTIEINLYHDDIKAIEYVFLNNQIQFETSESNFWSKGNKKKSNRNIPIYKINNDYFPIQIKVFDSNDIKSKNKNLLKMRGLDIEKFENFDPNFYLEDTQQPA